MSRKERLKVYHGLPKSIIDEHTLVYCENESTAKDRIVSAKYNLVPTLNGYGSLIVDPNLTSKSSFRFNRVGTNNQLTIDFLAKFEKPVSSENNLNLLKVFNESTGKGILLYKQWYNIFTIVTTDSTNINVTNHLVDNYNFIRLTINDTNLSLYINGKLVYTSNTYSCKFLNELNACELICQHSVISDIHISDIDRGSYFPNIPQDFIDGKAIVKPRMGQQQIKGDPLYSQETTDIVKITGTNEPQITCSRTTGNWASGDTIKVKGLGSEVISGVIDSDTALCKILSRVSDYEVIVDDTTKLSVGDAFNVFFASINGLGGSSTTRTITEINPQTGYIKFTGLAYSQSVYTSGYIYFTETTITSSSPLVKTADGTTITGTWSNLGTNEATFTLGTNATLTTQDLYITYSLNIAPGNSDFTELPYKIEKVYDEFGNELNEVPTLTIYDDFSSKVLGSVSECPHIYKYALNKPLSVLSGFAEVIAQDNYSRITVRDNTTTVSTSTLNTGVSQHLFSFNLIEIVERKLGKIPSANKVEWLRQNLTKIAFTHMGYGTSISGYKLYVANYKYTDNSWKNVGNHSSSTVSMIQCALIDSSIINDGRIDDNGFVHFVAYTDVCNGSTEVKIYTDQAFIEVSMKVDTTYKIYSSTSNKSREMPCNPILIQPETKTIRRYFPSNECFSTEILYSDPKATETSIGRDEIIYKLPLLYATTQGTGTYNPTQLDYYKECVAKLGAPLSKESYNYINEVICEYTEILSEYCPIRFKTYLSDSYYTNGYSTLPVDSSFKTIARILTIKPFIVNSKGELKLLIVLREFKYGKQSMSKHYIYKLPNNPLIK